MKAGSTWDTLGNNRLDADPINNPYTTNPTEIRSLRYAVRYGVYRDKQQVILLRLLCNCLSTDYWWRVSLF